MGFKTFMVSLTGSRKHTQNTYNRSQSPEYVYGAADEKFGAGAVPRSSKVSRRKSIFRSNRHGLPLEHTAPGLPPMLKHSRSEVFKRPDAAIELVTVTAVDDIDLGPERNNASSFDDDEAHIIPDTRIQRRQSLSKRLSRRLSMGLFSHAPEENTALPPMPTLPAAYSNPKPADAALKRKASTNKRRSVIWASSSNPDNDDEVPPTPALMRDTTPSPSGSSSSSRHRQRARADKRKSTTNPTARPGSSYVPRAAAKGFLSSTSGASDATRRSWRQSAMCTPGVNGSLVCLTDEQQREWERLKGLMNALEGRTTHFDDDDDAFRAGADEPAAHPLTAAQQAKQQQEARDAALAALEFGLAS